MKKMIALAALSLFASLATNAQEACNVGYSCEKSAGQNILRRTQLVQDENLLVCSTVTIANFKNDEAGCVAAAAKANDPVAQRYQCIADKMQAINSDIYYDLQPSDIDSMLQIPELVGHIDAVRSAKACDEEAKGN